MRGGEFAKFVDRTLMIRMTNGETAKVKVTFVDEETGAADIVSAELSEADLLS
jgi:hypothetical protein